MSDIKPEDVTFASLEEAKTKIDGLIVGGVAFYPVDEPVVKVSELQKWCDAKLKEIDDSRKYLYEKGEYYAGTTEQTLDSEKALIDELLTKFCEVKE